MPIILDRISRTVCCILINRAHKRNALNIEAVKKLQDTIYKFESDSSYHVAIIRGADGNFCSGYDLNEFIDCDSAQPNLDNIKQLLLPLGSKLSSKKITIAAIEGHAAGFGYELALKCDYRVADKNARLGFLNRRFGIPIMNGGTVTLPKLVGFARAKELIGTGKAQLAPEALNHGTITYIADVGCAQGRALNLAGCLSKFDQAALMHDLKTVDEQEFLRETDSLRRERTRSLSYLEEHNFPIAARFLKGELCRHGNTDLGNISGFDTEVTI